MINDLSGKYKGDSSPRVSSFSITIFLAAFLLFLIQPLISRYILPWFGGAPAVWSTSLLFFQSLLLVGYAYAHWLTTKNHRFIWLHLGLLLISIIIFILSVDQWVSPLLPDANWKPSGSLQPILRILLILLVSVGLPYFLLATASPMLQSWFKFIHPRQTPYRLYAISNFGSLLGLISYPFILEPLFGLNVQSWVWSALYLFYAALLGYLSVQVFSTLQKRFPASRKEGISDPSPVRKVVVPPPFHKLLWVTLSACASILLLSVTNQLTQEIAVIPMLWVLPLGIYLFSYILTFSGEKFYPRLPIITLLAVTTLSVGYRMNLLTSTRVVIQILTFSFFLLFSTIACHGELYRLRPDKQHLTSYYLYIALGGAIGGLFVNLFAPVIFKGYWELHAGILFCWILIVVLQFINRPSIFDSRWVGEVIPALLIILGVSGYLFARQINTTLVDVLDMERNFYGVTRVQLIEVGQPSMSAHELKHGTTSHGIQFTALEKRTLPASYYGKQSGAGLVLTYYSELSDQATNPENRKIGLVGLGIGTLAAYGQTGDEYRFYEINPHIIDLALGKGEYFTYISDSSADIKIIPGDARLSLDHEIKNGDIQNFDILVVDAFSSDSIPIHLLTVEAFDLYLEHLKPDGVLLLHISNRYLNLVPLVRILADHFELQHALIHSNQDDSTGSAAAAWMLLSKNPEIYQVPEIRESILPPTNAELKIRVWTDDYSNLLPLIKKDVLHNEQ